MDYKEFRKTITSEDKQLYIETVLKNPYIPITPFYEQMLILMDKSERKLIAGSAGSGKTETIAVACCRYLMYPEYSALILRTTYNTVKSEGSVVRTLERWLLDEERLGEMVCKHNQTSHYFEAPSGARIYYGAINDEKMMDKFRGTEYNFIALDEASEFDEETIDFIPRSLRKPEPVLVPKQLILASNPSHKPGADYLKEHYVHDTGEFPYFELDMLMNPFIDREHYFQTLKKMSPQQQAYMLYGDWDWVGSEGLLISSDDFINIQIRKSMYTDKSIVYGIIGIDLASTGKDQTSLTYICITDDQQVIISDNKLISDEHTEEPIKQFIEYHCINNRVDKVAIEKEGGSNSYYAGLHFEGVLARIMNKYGFFLDSRSTKGVSKYDRAIPLAYAIRNKLIWINEDIPNKSILLNQLIYIHPDKQVLGKYPSPDYLDSADLAFNCLDEDFSIVGLADELKANYT